MVQSCSAFNCSERYKKGSGVTFHRFPNDEALRKKWVLSLRREKFTPSPTAVICSKHFKENDYVIFNGKKKLKCNATPSQFDFPKHFMKETKVRSSKYVKLNEKREENEKQKISHSLNPDIPSTSCKDCTQRVVVNRKRRYFGDFKEDDFRNPKLAKTVWEIVKNKITTQNKKIKLLRVKNSRLIKKVKTLRELLHHLKEQKAVSEEGLSMLKESIQDSEMELLLRQLKLKTKEKFPPHLRSFALTLHFYSSSAYNYVRKTFNNCLPHPSTLRKWFSTVDGSPGYTAESLRALKLKILEAKQQGRQLICGLVMDEMSIRKHVEWNGKRYLGLVDIGTNIHSDALPEAREALVFMLVALNSRWKLPIGYFLIDGIGAAEKANLVKGCLKMGHDCGATIASVTFDGTTTNFAMASNLGAKLGFPNLEPWFLHPFTKERVHIILDVCHMIKLIRNAFGEWRQLLDGEGKLIDWRYFEELVHMQEQEGLHAANKLTKRHLNYKKEIMKVKLAVQLFSTSVAKALQFCEDDLHLENFEDVQATVNFCTTMNNIFDLLNIRNFLCKSTWGKPLSPNNEQDFFPFIERAKLYVSSLTDIYGRNVLQTRRKTGFLGLLICMTSVQNLYVDLVKKNRYMDYILTYKLNQDHIEMFFSAIRSRGGFNNNPTAAQFEGAYKRLLVHAEISSSSAANCIAQDEISILSITSVKKEQADDLLLDDLNEILKNDEEIMEIGEFQTPLTQYVSDITEYIAGFVTKKAVSIISCTTCAQAIVGDTSNSSLLKRKNLGLLCEATKDVVTICKTAEKLIHFEALKRAINIKNVICLAVKSINISKLFVTLNEHILNQDPLNNHVIQLVYLILKIYLTIRIHHRNTQRNQIENRVRRMYTKLIKFRNE